MARVQPQTAAEWAAVYCQLGLVPLVLTGKKCYTDDWPHSPMPALADLPRLFPPGSNIGILLGPPSGGVLDGDADHPYCRRCWDLWPSTPVQFGRPSLAPHGTTHRLYTGLHVPESFVEEAYLGYRDRKKIFELRYRGRQTMAPGSVHPDNHEPICNLGGWPLSRPAEVEFETLLHCARLTAAIAIIAECWPGPGLGRSNDWSLAVCGGLVTHGVPVEDVVRIVCRAAQLRGDPDYRTRGQTAASAARKLHDGENVRGFTWLEREFNLPGFGAHLCDQMRLQRKRLQATPSTPGGGYQGRAQASGEPGGQQGPPRSAGDPARGLRLEPPPDPYPVCALPPVIREAVIACAPGINVEPQAIAVLAVAACAGAVGNCFRITANGDWQEPCCLWGLLVGDSGSRKSAAFKLALRGWMEWQCERIREYRTAQEFDRTALQEYRDEKRSRGRRGDEDGPELVRPTPTAVDRCRLVTDCTPESIARVLHENPEGILHAVEEATQFFEMLTAYGSGNKSAQYLTLYDGGLLTVRRVNKDRNGLAVENALMAMAGTIQPWVFRQALTDRNIHSGLMSRFLIAWCDPRINYYVRNPQHLAEEEALACLQRRLLDLTLLEGRPRLLRLSPQAEDFWEEAHNTHALRVYHAANGPVRSADYKWWGACMRWALLDHVVRQLLLERDLCAPVGRESVENAVANLLWFSREHGRLYPYLISQPPTLDESLERRILNYFRRRPEVQAATVKQLRDVLRDRSGKVTYDTVTGTIEHLASVGLGTLTRDGDVLALNRNENMNRSIEEMEE